MNEYKITYSGESEGYRLVVDSTEAAAKKYFREQAKELDLGRITIDDVELVSDNAMATKRNERETLETIRQMVADLGEQSYLATAFQGCFEDAEDNIDDDAAYSYKGRYEHVREQLDEAKKKIEELEGKLTQEIAEKQQVRDEAQKTIKELEEKLRESEKDWEAAHAANHVLAEQKDAEIAALQAKALSEDDLEDLRQLLDDRATEADEKAEAAALEIVERADTPDHPDFRQAVLDHRNYVKTAKYYREILGRVVEAQAAYHAGA